MLRGEPNNDRFPERNRNELPLLNPIVDTSQPIKRRDPNDLFSEYHDVNKMSAVVTVLEARKKMLYNCSFYDCDDNCKAYLQKQLTLQTFLQRLIYLSIEIVMFLYLYNHFIVQFCSVKIS